MANIADSGWAYLGQISLVKSIKTQEDLFMYIENSKSCLCWVRIPLGVDNLLCFLVRVSKHTYTPAYLSKNEIFQNHAEFLISQSMRPIDTCTCIPMLHSFTL
jgi:hypothetical protein